MPGMAPPQKADIDEAVLFRCLAFHVEGGNIDGRREAVQRHVDDRGDAARRGRPGGAGKALPFGAAGVVDVHVGVHQAGQEDLIKSQPHYPIGREISPEIADSGNPSAAIGNRARHLALDGDRPRGVQHEVVLLGHDEPTRCSAAMRPASCSSSGAAFVIDRCMSGSRSFKL